MENPEEILHSLEEFTKTKPKDIPRELEDYLCFVAKTGDPVYQWPAIKSLFREKMINVITDFYETCPSVEIPPCPNVDLFNYDVMKNFILEKLDTFAAAPFTLQRICELLTTPRKEYNRIDKYMRALEKNVLVVSTVEPGGRRATENGDSIVNGLEGDHLPESSNSSNDINVEEMDDAPSWPRLLQNDTYQSEGEQTQQVQETAVSESKSSECSSSEDSESRSEDSFASCESVPVCEQTEDGEVSNGVTPAGVQKRRSSVEPVVSSEGEEITESSCDKRADSPKDLDLKQEEETSSSSSPSSQQIEDADSSSSTEDDKDERISEILPDEAAPQDDPSSTQKEDKTEDNEVGTTEDIQVHQESEEDKEVEGSEPIVDTTKCSILPEEPQDKDVEISSSERSDEVDSSQNEALSEESSREAEELQVERVEAECEKEELMEVDEAEAEGNSDDVKAETTSALE